MWSLGVLLYTLLFSENPFCGVEEILNAKLRIPFPLSLGICPNDFSLVCLKQVFEQVLRFLFAWS